MDVKYIPSDWEKMKDGIGDLIGLGRWGKGMIDELKDLSDILEDAESDIAKYDVDGAITFQHSSQKSKYQGLFEDFDVLHNFSGKVGDIVDRTIDQPFYEDMDAFVAAMRDLSISNYTTTNRIGATEIVHSYAGYGVPQQFEIDKAEVSLDDLLSGDNFYGEQMKLEYEAWRELNPDQDFSQKEYQQAIVNTRAFEYESIRNTQENKEFWFQIGALVVIVGATLIFPPAGIALGAAYGAYELSSALSGKDLVSGRELDTSERWVRGALAPLDIIPGVSGLTKFGSAARLARVGDNLGPAVLRSSVKGGIQQGATTRVYNMVVEAGKSGAARLKSAGTVIQNRANMVINKVEKDIIEAAIGTGKLADKVHTGMKDFGNMFAGKELAVDGVGALGRFQDVNTHVVENKVKDLVSKFEVNISDGITKGTGNGSSAVIGLKTFIDKGKQFTNGRRNKLKPDIRYKTGEYDYYYETDNLGRISKFETENLLLTNREERLPHSRNTPGKVKGQDHAGHLAGDRFGGSPKIDNLVSQLSDVNLKQYKKVEDEWAIALKETPPKKVTVDVEIVYAGNDMRPEKFIVNYTIDGEWGFKVFKN